MRYLTGEVMRTFVNWWQLPAYCTDERRPYCITQKVFSWLRPPPDVSCSDKCRMERDSEWRHYDMSFVVLFRPWFDVSCSDECLAGYLSNMKQLFFHFSVQYWGFVLEMFGQLLLEEALWMVPTCGRFDDIQTYCLSNLLFVGYLRTQKMRLLLKEKIKPNLAMQEIYCFGFL